MKLAEESNIKNVLSFIESAKNNDNYRNINFLSDREWLTPRMYRGFVFDENLDCYIIYNDSLKEENIIEGVLITNRLSNIYKLTSLGILNIVYKKNQAMFTKELLSQTLDDNVTKIKINMPQRSDLIKELGLNFETKIKFKFGTNYIYSLLLKENSEI
jgi:hypothetical protein